MGGRFNHLVKIFVTDLTFAVCRFHDDPLGPKGVVQRQILGNLGRAVDLANRPIAHQMEQKGIDHPKNHEKNTETAVVCYPGACSGDNQKQGQSADNQRRLLPIDRPAHSLVFRIGDDRCRVIGVHLPFNLRFAKSIAQNRRPINTGAAADRPATAVGPNPQRARGCRLFVIKYLSCLLYTSDAADEL